MNSFTAALLLALASTTQAESVRGARELFISHGTPPAGFGNPVTRAVNPVSDPNSSITYERQAQCSTYYVPCGDCRNSKPSCSFYVCNLESQTDLCVPPDSELLLDDVPGGTPYQKFGCGPCSDWTEKATVDLGEFGGGI